MFTTWKQIEDWIKDNQFDRWMFSRNRPGDDEKFTKTVDSDYYAGDEADKLAMTKKYLEGNGGHFYGYGYKKATGTKGAVSCEVDLAQSYQQLQPTAGVGMAGVMGSSMSVGELRESIRKELEAEWDKREYKRLREDLDKERKAFEEEKNSALGLITGYLAPIGKALLERKVAGIDAEEPVHAQRIVADDGTPLREERVVEKEETAEVVEERPFTDEEEEKLYDLLARFKKAEPEYMQLIEAVVEMAEKGDTMYGVAKNALLKK